jgi:hypothetical protein
MMQAHAEETVFVGIYENVPDMLNYFDIAKSVITKILHPSFSMKSS